MEREPMLAGTVAMMDMGLAIVRWNEIKPRLTRPSQTTTSESQALVGTSPREVQVQMQRSTPQEESLISQGLVRVCARLMEHGLPLANHVVDGATLTPPALKSGSSKASEDRNKATTKSSSSTSSGVKANFFSTLNALSDHLGIMELQASDPEQANLAALLKSLFQGKV